MTKEKYQLKLQQLYKEYEKKVKELGNEYAIDNNPYVVGDIFRDHIGYIKIEKINVGVPHTNIPCCIYWGTELKVDGAPKKSGVKRDAWQCNEVK